MIAAVFRMAVYALIVLGALSVGDTIRSLFIAQEVGDTYWLWVRFGVSRTRVLLVGAAMLSLAASLILVRSARARGVFASAIVLSWLAVYAFEIIKASQPVVYLGTVRQAARAEAARRAGIPFDTRTLLEVLEAPENAGLRPHFNPAVYVGKRPPDAPLPPDSEAILPLSSWPRQRTVYCNEGGYWVVYESDRFGFRNSDQSWDKPVDVLVVGDSLANGGCVRDDESWVALLARSRPTIALSGGGSGPLQELALIREYIGAVRPKIVLLQVSIATDLEELLREARNPVLLSYFNDPTFTQRLMQRREEAGRALEALAAEALAREKNPTRPAVDFLRLLSVPHTRELAERVLKLARDGLMSSVADASDERLLQELRVHHDIRQFVEVVERMKRASAEHGARLLIALFPSHAEVQLGRPHREAKIARAALRAKGFAVVDLFDDFMGHDRPVELFPFGVHGHYTPEGNMLAARALAVELDRLLRKPAP
jgi:hypothetical protein